MSDRVAFSVEINNMRAIVFAETKAKAKWIAVRGYWDAYGKNGWPRSTVRREPRFDKNPLREGERVPWTQDHVESYQL